MVPSQGRSLLPVGLFAALLLAAPSLRCQSTSAAGYPEYRAGDMERAIPLLQQTVAAHPDDAVSAAALLSALVYEGRLKDATQLAQSVAQKFPLQEAVVLARGEYAYYLGDLLTAAQAFRQVIAKDPKNGRAVSDLSELYFVESRFRSSRLLAMQAYNLDPEDGIVGMRYMRFLQGPARAELLRSFMDAHPWFYRHANEAQSDRTAVHEELAGRRPFELQGPREEIVLPLTPMRNQRGIVTALALRMQIEGHGGLNLVLDTGASGILIGQRAVDKAGLTHVGAGQANGIGDDGARKAFTAVADFCDIGEIRYKTCVFGALEGRRSVNYDTDGLIGADFFSDYRIDIDFQKQKLHLTPLGERPPNPQGYDREIPTDEKDFTPFYRTGHELWLPVRVNQKATGLFLLDTGASSSLIDLTFAREVGKVERNSSIHIRGIAGEVNQVFELSRVTVQFAHYEQEMEQIAAVNLNGPGGHGDFRMSGIFGIPLLSLFHMTLDYRNGLVHFDYILGEKRR